MTAGHDPTRAPLLLVVSWLNTGAIVCVLFLIANEVPEFCEAPRFAGAKHRANSGNCFPYSPIRRLYYQGLSSFRCAVREELSQHASKNMLILPIGKHGLHGYT